jgi:HD-GYP domain-containing protein (c-di-GMP phosphodiesterase class II)
MRETAPRFGPRPYGRAVMEASIENGTQAAVEALVAALDRRDGYTARHAEEVVELVRRVGERIGLDELELAECELAGRLHDVGKIGVPDTILQKPGPLDPAEWEVMRRHPRWSAEMIAAVPGLERVAAIVHHHHERFDGTGYPDGLEGEEIPLCSRVLAVCDAYGAMLSDRPYRRALEPEQGLRLLRAGAGAQFDPVAVEALTGLATASKGGRPE